MAYAVAGRMGDGSGITLSSVADASQDWGTRIELRKVSKGDVKEMEFLGAWYEIVYIVKLKQNKIVDHCVVVSCNRCVVLDIAEPLPLTIWAEVIILCVCDAVKSMGFCALQEIVDEKECKNCKKKKKYRNLT